MNKNVLLALTALCCVCVMRAQIVSIATMPRAQAENGQATTFTITPTVSGFFSATIFLRASSPTLPGASFKFSPAQLNAPYQKTSTMTVSVTGAKTAGDHEIIVEGYNGPLSVKDTVRLSIVDRPAWTIYTTTNSPILSDVVNCIAFDKIGRAWIGTDNGLARYDNGSWKVWDIRPDDRHHLYSVTAIAIDSSGAAWVGSTMGLFVMRDTVLEPMPLGGNNTRPIQAIATGSDGAVWAMANRMIYKYFQGSWTAISPESSMKFNVAEDLEIDNSNHAWIMHLEEVVDRFDGAYWTRFDRDDFGKHSYGVHRCITKSPDGHIWVANEHGTLYEFNGAELTIHPRDREFDNDSSFPGPESIRDLLFDNLGNKWVGSTTGLRRFTGNEKWYYNIGNSGLPSNNVITLQTDANNNIWIGTDKGLAILDGNAPPITAFTTSVDEEGISTTASMLNGIAPHPITGAGVAHLNVVDDKLVRMTVHDIHGTEVAVLCNQILERGQRQIPFSVGGLSTGAYIIRLVADGTVESHTIIVNP